MRACGIKFGLVISALIIFSLFTNRAGLALNIEESASHTGSRPTAIASNAMTLPMTLSTGVTFSPQVDGNIMVPLVITYVGPTAPGENPYIAYIDQPIIAKTTEPLVLQTGRVLPTGTVFTGHVMQVVPEKRFVRNGYAVLHFDSIVTENGTVIPVDSRGSPRRDLRSAHIQRMLVMSNGALSGALGGLVIGTGFVIYSVISNPESIVPAFLIGCFGGPLVGAAVGATASMLQKGEPASSSLARPVTVPVSADSLMKASIPWDVEEEIESPVVFKSVRSTGFTNPYRLQVEGVVANDSDEVIESSDLVLENQAGDHFPIYYDSVHNGATVFNIPPHSVRRFFVCFEPDVPHTGFKLVWYKHLSNLKQPLVEFKLP